MDKIKVVIENRQKDIKIPTGLRMLVRRCCNAVINSEGMEGDVEVNVFFVDNDTIRQYNNEHRSIDKVTDVLSFPLGIDGEYDRNPESGLRMLGDIVISLEIAEKQANDYGHTFQREVAFLTTHSMLHLLGYDHTDGALETVKMREQEEKIMTLMGLSRTGDYEDFQ